MFARVACPVVPPALPELLNTTCPALCSLHGGADLSGPFLLPGDAEPPDGDKNRLRLERILDSLGKLDSKRIKS